ncbi:hypothetical protein KI659_03145 [Litoribacter alkaliphilus]|uniref:DUF922 domain-containing protein n=1 Tax=Litoribacter ruber TaxID=702568 RepID=A0AAP2CGB0_9BACT|nr:hypothetical protein [Litoribacter alkaliphilus]MBS9523004.1 hypothetical protein [Litoribacter alkaliphilus]
MKKPVRKYPKIPLRVIPFILSCLFLLCISKLFAQDQTFIAVDIPQVDWQPKGYVLEGFTDERTNQELGQIFISPSYVQLGRLERSVSDILGQLAPSPQIADHNNMVFGRVMDLRVEEKVISSNVVEGKIHLSYAFEQLKNDRFSHLLDYQGGVTYKRSIHRTDLIGSALGKALVAGLSHFNDWMEAEIQSNPSFSTQLHLSIENYEANEVGDTLFYHPDRPLTWEDFKDRPRSGSRFAASIFPSFSIDGDTELIDGELVLNMKLKVYMLKNASWVSADSKNAYGLNHEQRHFDLVKIVGERFRNRLLIMGLDPEDYESEINFEYLEAFREMNRLQAAYDEATSHGRNKQAQAQWDKLIDEILASQAWYKVDEFLR